MKTSLSETGMIRHVQTNNNNTTEHARFNARSILISLIIDA